MPKFTMKFLPDEPLQPGDEDILGFGKFVTSIEQAVDRTKPPFVFGVLGDWGVGKTSILRMLEQRFVQRSATADGTHVVPIWFNAWEYENEADVVYPLLYAIRAGYKRDVEAAEIDDRGFMDAFREVALTSAYITGDVLLGSVSKLLTGNALSIDDIRKPMDEVRERQSQLEQIMDGWATDVDKLKKSFSKMLTLYAEGVAEVKGVPVDSIRFLILIDDLDRCLPDTTIRLLESIKNYLTYKNQAIFVMGLNARIVYQGIRHKYRSVELDGREYLEKILNYTFYVPEPDRGKIREFTRHQINLLVDPDEADARAPISRSFRGVRECLGRV